MKKKNIVNMVLAALFAAMVCVGTIVIQIPSPMNGYIHFGDCFVLLCGWVMGPFYGFLAGGLGSMLADILTGYAHYAPASLVIKGLVAVAAALICRKFHEKSDKYRVFGAVVSGIAGEVIMVAGYFGYACLLLGKGIAAAASIPGNLIQGLAGIVSAAIILRAVSYARQFRANIYVNRC